MVYAISGRRRRERFRYSQHIVKTIMKTKKELDLSSFSVAGVGHDPTTSGL